MAAVVSEPQRTCFVVMGFGKKTDFQSQPQRTLDLDKTYRIIIKPAVEEAGFKCIRADDVVHAGIIDLPMYELLLNADVVVADLSTSNANAIYELGVRHALRPNTTIVLAEDQFKFPFDLGHLVIRKYEHLGAGIDAEVAEEVRKELRAAIEKLTVEVKTDSPVYTFLHQLQPPSMPILKVADEESAAAAVSAAVDDATNTVLLEAGNAALAKSDFVTAQMVFGKLNERQPNDPYIIQQLALATYKSKLPSKIEALTLARGILQTLKPESSSDAETLGLWGAIHKRLWEERKPPIESELNEAVWAYERGFYLRNDYYTGINYAFLLNVQADVAMQAGNRGDAIADFVAARRVRKRVIERLEPQAKEGAKDDAGKFDATETFWLRATLIEAYVGVGNAEAAAALTAQLAELNPAGWMVETLNVQVGKLRALLDQQEPLLK